MCVQYCIQNRHILMYSNVHLWHLQSRGTVRGYCTVCIISRESISPRVLPGIMSRGNIHGVTMTGTFELSIIIIVLEKLSCSWTVLPSGKVGGGISKCLISKPVSFMICSQKHHIIYVILSGKNYVIHPTVLMYICSGNTPNLSSLNINHCCNDHLLKLYNYSSSTIAYLIIT